MTYRGRVKGGVILLDEPVTLPEGTSVNIVVAPQPQDSVESVEPTLYEQLRAVIGSAQGLPTDLAENHDHYLHGLPKK